MKALLEDSWVQIFAFLALVCGAMLCVQGMGWRASGRRLAPLPAPPAALEEAPRPAFPPAPALSGPGAQAAAERALSRGNAASDALGAASRAGPRKPGLWVVDGRRPGDEDSATIAEAVAAARDGEAIHIRPGVYRESLVISKSLSLMGLGSRRQDVTIQGQAAVTLAIASGKVLLKNLAVSHAGPSGSHGLGVNKGAASLEAVEVVAAGGALGVVVNEASLSASGSHFEGDVGLRGVNSGRIEIADCTVSGSGSRTGVGVSLFGAGVRATVSKSRVYDSIRGFEVAEGASLALVSSLVTKVREAGVLAVAGSLIEIRDSVLALDHTARVGIYARDSRVRLEKSQVSDSADAGIDADARAAVTVEGGKLSGHQSFGAMVREGSSLRLSGAEVSGCQLCGLLVLEDARLELERGRLHKNLCGLAIGGPARILANRNDLTGNARGPILVKPGVSSGVVLRGQNNRPSLDSALIQESPAAEAPARVVSRTSFGQWDIFRRREP